MVPELVLELVQVVRRSSASELMPGQVVRLSTMLVLVLALLLVSYAKEELVWVPGKKQDGLVLA
jgi:hypothetical protein